MQEMVITETQSILRKTYHIETENSKAKSRVIHKSGA